MPIRKGKPIEPYGYNSIKGVIHKNGKEIPVPICRECQVQAPCSKWAGKYPYEKAETEFLEKLERGNHATY